MGSCFSTIGSPRTKSIDEIELPQQLQIREEYIDDGKMIDVDIYEGPYFVGSEQQKESRERFEMRLSAFAKKYN
jgi:hypothetical protein